MQQNQLASVNYNRLAQLKKHTGADNNLWLVYDALVFSWQNSKIVQKGKKLCCPTISRIAELANVSTRTVLRKLKILEEMGLIDSFTKRLRNGTVRRFFNVCIEKISSIVNSSSKESQNALQPSNHAESDKLSHPEVTGCHFHIYKEKTVKEKNNINSNTAKPENNKHIDQQGTVNVNCVATAQVDVALPDRQAAKTVNPEDKIGNTLTNRQHCRINGAINNLIRKECIRISDPKGLKAQVAFKILLKSEKSGGRNFQHQLNAAMKLIREGKWSTPHGFYNYCDEGKRLKNDNNEREKQRQKQKKQNCYRRNSAYLPCMDISNNQLVGGMGPALSQSSLYEKKHGRININGELVLVSNAKSRLYEIEGSIKRYTDKIRYIPEHLHEVFVNIINRLKAEKGEITQALAGQE